MNIWESFRIKDENIYFRQIGPLKIWIQHKNSEWLTASDRSPGEKETIAADELTTFTDTVKWYRQVIPKNVNQIRLVPTTPDRAIVVKPESELKISAEADALFFVLVPLWIKIIAGYNGEFVLTEIPSQILSNTWFGEPYDGELCYSLKTSARRSLEGLIPRPNQVVCPVYIKNTSSVDLDFSRLCIRTEFLSLYQGSSWLWTNKIHVQFRGVNQISKIKYDNNEPDYEKMSGLIGKPRSKPVKDFSIKSFDTFKMFTG